MATRIIVTRRLPEAILAPLRARPATTVHLWDSDAPMPRARLLEAAAADGGAHAVICMLSDRIDAEVMGACGGSLVSVATMSVGYSHIDVPAAVARRVRIGYTPGILTESTADLVLALTLATCRKVVPAAAAVRSGEWASWTPFWMTGKDVHGARVGIVGGAGRIGRAVARRLRGFGCTISYTGRSGPAADFDAELGAPSWAPLPALLAGSDIVVLLCALTDATRGMIDAAALRSMRPDAVLINAARGEVVVQEDLVEVMRERPGMAAGLDVCYPEPLPVDSPLLSLPNVLVLPHIGSASVDTRMRMAEATVANTFAALDGAPLPFEVPETAAGVPRA